MSQVEHQGGWQLTDAMLDIVTSQGVLGAAARHHFARPGKQVRGSLALACAESLGIGSAPARRLAMACELLHNASLVHDDIQDRDAMRRGHTAVWQRFGDEVAINLGDELLVQAMAIVAELAVDAPTIIPHFRDTITTVIRGQSDELVRRGEPCLARHTYETIAADKTGAMLALPILGALLLARRPPRELDIANSVARLAGTAFQLHDDLQDIHGNKGRGLPGADLLEGKLTWPWIAFLESAQPAAKRGLMQMLAARNRRQVDVMPWIVQIRASTALHQTRQRVGELLAEATDRARSALTPELFSRLQNHLIQPLAFHSGESATVQPAASHGSAMPHHLRA